MQKEIKFGLVGKNISYSFSKKYFTQKFKQLKLDDCSYDNFDIQSIDDLPVVLNKYMNSLKGFNITIPYKEDIFKYLDEIEEDAMSIGAVNTVKIIENFKLKGYNTDIYGFEKSLRPLLSDKIEQALILGTGGASKAIAFVLDKLNINYKFVSRVPENELSISYDDLCKEIVSSHHLIINCTPLGTFPDIERSPDIPYQFLGEDHILFDLIYNPEETSFLIKGKKMGALIKNGKQMLELQADKAWEIWNTSP